MRSVVASEAEQGSSACSSAVTAAAQSIQAPMWRPSSVVTGWTNRAVKPARVNQYRCAISRSTAAVWANSPAAWVRSRWATSVTVLGVTALGVAVIGG